MKVSELKYPDVIHISNKEQHDKIKRIINKDFNSYNEKYFYYLVGGGYSENKYPIQYNNIEFEDIEFEADRFDPIPEKWCVKVTKENKFFLDEWREKQTNVDFGITLDLDSWLLSDRYDGSYCSYKIGLPEEYTEISFERFKKYIYKVEIMSDRVCVKYYKEKDRTEYLDKYLEENSHKYVKFSSHWTTKGAAQGYYFYPFSETNVHSETGIKEGFTEISFKEFKKRFPLKSHIPKYVRLITDSVWSVPKGEICEVVRENIGASQQWVLKVAITKTNMQSEGGDKFYIMKDSCVEATEEEYNAQFKKVKEGKFYSFKWKFNPKYKPIYCKVKHIDGDYFTVNWNCRVLDGKKIQHQTDGFNYENITDLKEISLEEVQQYLPEGHPDKITKMITQFIKGKWYKDISTPDLIIKFDRNNGDDWIYSSERVCGEKYEVVRDDCWITKTRNWVEVTDLSEIQKYLPAGHVDKITKVKTSLGKWYKRTDKNPGPDWVWYVKDRTDQEFYSGEDNEHITFSGKYIVEPGCYRSTSNWILLTDLSEIQQYLPDNHIDKMEKHIFKPGDKVYLINKDVEDSYWTGIGKIHVYLDFNTLYTVTNTGMFGGNPGLEINGSWYPINMFIKVTIPKFAIKYTKDFTPELFEHLIKWVSKNKPAKRNNRGFTADTFENFILHGWFLCWGITQDNGSYYFAGVDNNNQGLPAISVNDLKNIIGYKESTTVGITTKVYEPIDCSKTTTLKTPKIKNRNKIGKPERKGRVKIKLNKIKSIKLN